MNDDNCGAGPFASLDFWGEGFDPDPILPIVPMLAYRPKRKGDPLGPARNGKLPVAKFGGCNFFTHDFVPSRDPSAHIRYILDAITPCIQEIRAIIVSQGIEWRITLFEGSGDREKLKDVDPILLESVRELGIPMEVEMAWLRK